MQEKYDNVSLIENEDYRAVNNISSIYYACSVLGKGDCFICEADLYIARPEIFDADMDRSCYWGKYVEGYSGTGCLSRMERDISPAWEKAETTAIIWWVSPISGRRTLRF